MVYLWHFIIAPKKKLTPVVFYAQPNSNNFNLVRGAYFFYLSQLAAIEIKTDFMYSEIQLLKIAIEYSSVHAMKRYNDYYNSITHVN